jgi:hypothetical protein
MVSIWDSVPVPRDVLEIPLIVQQVRAISHIRLRWFPHIAFRVDVVCRLCAVETAIRSLHVDHTRETEHSVPKAT